MITNRTRYIIATLMVWFILAAEGGALAWIVADIATDVLTVGWNPSDFNPADQPILTYGD